MTDAPLAALQRVSVAHLDARRPTPREVSLEIRPGEVVLLLGPSGSGKSTLALTLNGLVPHHIDADVEGVVRIDGRDVAASSPARLSTRVGMVFQDPDAQLVASSVLDEVAFGLENLLLDPAEVMARSEEALRRVGLWERRHDDPDELSGGGKQRLAIACALAMRSPLLVLDEPTANLDPAGARDVYDALAALVAAGDHAILLVEHDIDAALPLATRVVVLDGDGRLVQDGSPGEVLAGHAAELRALGVWLPREGEPAYAPVAGPDDDAGPPAVSARGLTVRTGRGRARRALIRDVSLDIPAGSFTAVVGPNGAGKTTLAQALAGVVPPPRGTVRVAGLDAGAAPPRRLAERVGFVFQNPEHQFVAHTVRGELEHSLRHVPRAERDSRVDAMLARFGLPEHAERHPYRLSGGQKRRLSVATALIAGADRPGGVLVLDEPTFGQDRARADELLTLLDELHARGTTIVVVTHDLRLVAAHATHIAVMDGGELTAFGPAHETLPAVRDLFARPRPGEPAGTARDEAPATRRAPLERLDPLARLVAVLPALIGVVFTRDVATPAALALLSALVLLIGARRDRRLALWLAAALPAMFVVLSAGFALWTDPLTGTATGTRLTAMLAIALVPGLTTSGPELVRALVRHLRLPYRIGYAALAAYRFAPRLRRELGIIRAAHRVRGTGGTWLSRTVTSLVPLMAGAIRHAERVALAMDARAFGAHSTRTERHVPRWRPVDTGAVAVGWATTAVVFFTGATLSLPAGWM
ncbi:ATP-binding cassette domain-containing protein [Microbacterium sp. Marseille-Q6965]|uniref:ATP-binding cassette domain-containing protein n=1 Tax=Microbacterium sp. Marseille-Q6965 TaxID=2965072 RepID=UPI0021B7CF4C|nr:ATP-binding cassette domain-containing protein [Microbacterium sp. Marseille-Q6965]